MAIVARTKRTLLSTQQRAVLTAYEGGDLGVVTGGGGGGGEGNTGGGGGAALSLVAPPAVAGASAAGTGTAAARGDHTHAGVLSFKTRQGAVVPASGDYSSSEVSNSSSVAGAHVTAALNALLGAVDGLSSDAVDNASTVTGATVSAALNTLLGVVDGLSSDSLDNASTVTGATVSAALNTLKAADLSSADKTTLLALAAAPPAGMSGAQVELTDQTAELVNTDTDASLLYAQNIIGHRVLTLSGPNSVPARAVQTSLQSARWYTQQGSAGFVNILANNNGSPTTASQPASATPTTIAQLIRQYDRTRFSTTTATAAAVSRMYGSNQPLFRGALAKAGGFFVQWKWAFVTTSGMYAMVGLFPDTTGGATGNVNWAGSMSNAPFITFGVSPNFGAGNVRLMHNSGGLNTDTTTVATGLQSASSEDLFEGTFYCPPNSTAINWAIRKLNQATPAYVTGVASSNIPAATQPLFPGLSIATVGSVQTIDIVSVYAELLS